MSAYVGGQLAKITDLDNWKETFKGMYNNWINGSATMSAFVGGQIGSITDLGTKEGGWQKVFTSMYNAWQSKDAEMTVTNKIGDAVNAAISTLGAGVGGWAYYMTQLTNAWHGGDASFTTEFDEQQSTLDSWAQTIGNLAGVWEGKKATFELTFSAAADDLKSWVNTNVISKINAQFDKVPILKNHHIPLLARGGIVDTATMFVAGEAGKEAVIPLERNLEWLDNMATRISDKIMNLAIPDVVTGAILPASKEFVQVYNANTEKISMQLNDIIARLSALETAGTSREPIILQVNGHVLAQLIWDENEKRYKQYGY
jgi:leucyl-tRNA synthetase